MHYTLEQFESFLNSIDLDDYRNRFSPIKIVEMDLDKNVQPLKDMYEVYWNHDDITDADQIMSFDNFYRLYYANNRDNIIAFKRKVRFGESCDCFDRGLMARIYRTWASLITQIHAGYVAERIFGIGNVEMSEDLDHRNIDFKVTYSGHVFGIQIKK